MMMMMMMMMMIIIIIIIIIILCAWKWFQSRKLLSSLTQTINLHV